MKILEITSAWSADCKIDELNIDREALRIPGLHSKYVAILVGENEPLRKLYRTRIRLRKTLRDYYGGHLDQAELKEIGRDPPLRLILKNEQNEYIDADPWTINLGQKIAEAEEKVEVLREIIKSVNNRGFQLKTATDWARMTMGA